MLTVQVINLMYVCPCIIYETVDRYPLDATIYLLLSITLHVSTIYMPIFRSIRLYTYYATPYGVQHLLLWLRF